ncbi:MAG: rod-binding protein [Rhodovarius sp.]|nr:rod-binding protein [Rhodovarius sp.]MCX7932431.1 rod-binding protein [Rhodovarius sp.]MDW8313727.1 rod-binding protein [Rhodovarius sp.]
MPMPLPAAPIPPATPPLPSAPRAQQNPALQRALAQRFEAQVLAQLLSPVFAGIGQARGPFGGGAAEEHWRPMLTEAFAERMAARGGIGIAALLLAQLQRQPPSVPQEVSP